MTSIINRFENIKSIVNNSNVKIIAVSKTFSYDYISPLVDYGHLHFGENKVQEAQFKWTNLQNKKIFIIKNLNILFKSILIMKNKSQA